MIIIDFKREIFTALAIYLFSITLYAGGVSARHISIGGGYANPGMRDTGLSPLYYSGGHFMANAGYLKLTDSLAINLEISFITGTMTPGSSPEPDRSQLKNLRGGIRFSYHGIARSIIDGRGKLRIGGSLETHYANYRHDKFINSAVTNYFFSTISLSGSLSYPLNINDRGYQIELHASLPLAALSIRPSYSYILPAGFLEHNRGAVMQIINSMELSSFNRFFGLNTGASIGYKLKNNHIIKIYYSWEYLSHRDFNTLESITHRIALLTFINF